MIIIPSEKIYNKNNPKIIKNNYSGVSAKAQIPRRKRNDDINVLNIDEVLDASYTSEEITLLSNVAFDGTLNNALINSRKKAAILVGEIPKATKIVKQYIVPKKNGNITINGINTTSVYGTVFGVIETYDCTAKVVARHTGANGNKINEVDTLTYEIGNYRDTTYDVAGVTIGSETNPVEISVSSQQNLQYGVNRDVSLNITLKWTLPTLLVYEFEESTDNYIVEIQTYSNYEYYSVSGISNKFEQVGNVVTGQDEVYTFEKIHGTYSKFIAEAIQFSINGESYEISLTENDLFVGDSKSNVYAIQETNELMQMSPKLQDNIRQIYNQYKNTGKEVATIRCSIADYFDKQGNKIVSIDPIPNIYNLLSVIEVDNNVDDYYSPIYFRWLGTEQGYFSLDADHRVSESIEVEDGIFAIQFTKDQDNAITFQIWDEGYGSTELGRIVFDTTKLKYGTTYTLSFTYGASKSAYMYECHMENIMLNIGEYNYKPPMTIPMHSEVIPYVFKANGKDAPMSTYQDGSPKVFQVVGNRITYDGAVWQELTMIEVKQNEN